MSGTLYFDSLTIKELDSLEIIKNAIDQINDWVLITDITGEIVYINPVVEKLSGYSNKELIGNKPSVLKSEIVPNDVYKTLWETILDNKVYSNVITNRHKSGSLYYIACRITPIKDDEGVIKHFISTGREINHGSDFENQIYKVIQYDALTGLLKRDLMIEKIAETKQKVNNLAIVALTINKLGLINSRYGFVWGDKTIQEVGSRIKNIIYKECTVSRAEGKVFAILYPEYKNPYKIVGLIKRIEESFKEPIRILNEEVYVSIRFGISTYVSNQIAETDVDADALLTRAQLALSKVKDSSSLENYEFYTSSMKQQVNDQIYMEKEIYTAYKNDEFISYFQPLINLKTGEISGLEALMRRKKSTGEIVSPIQFISFLEESGLIIQVGFGLIEKICTQMKSWIDIYGSSLPVSINLSPVQFKDEYFCEKMMEIVTRLGVPPELITFEITESVLIEDVNRTICILERLRLQGFSISIDDFGTGYSSLSYIQKFKINRIKIDMSFVSNIVTSEADQTIVKAIVMMAEGLKLETIAEGVETKEQLEIIREIGSNIGQGYYWEKPLPAEEITRKYFDSRI